MDEKDNENEVVDKVKDTAKGVAKKGAKNIIKIILPKLLPVIGIFVLILLAIGVINAIVFAVQSFFTSLVSGNNPTDEIATVADNSKSLVCINENGGYDLSIENFSQQILDKLEEQKVDSEAAEFITDNFEDMIDKYIKAEVQTMYPKTDIKGDFDGLIKIQRASAQTGNVETLEYVPYEQFKASPSLSKFSINPETFDLCIATTNTTIYKDFNGNEIPSLKKSSTKKREIEYQTSIQNYSMPFNFFLSLHMIAQDTKFMNELVDGVLEKKDPIILTYVESTTITTTQYDYDGKAIVTTTITTYINGAVEEPTEETSVETITVDNSNVDNYIELNPEYHIEEETTNSGTLYVTKADTWLEKLEKGIGDLSSEDVPSDNNSEKVVFEDVITDGPDIVTVPNSDETNYTQIKKVETDLKIKQKITGNTKYLMYTMVNETRETKEEEIIELIKSYPKVENNLTTAPSNLLYLLQQSETTQYHEEVMRYIIYKLTGVDYGITVYPSCWDAFGTFGGLYGNSIEEKVWFALRDAGYSEYAVAGAMGNIYAESGFNPSVIESGTGIGFGLCQWSFGRRTQLESYARSKGVEPSDLQTQIEFLITEITPGAQGPAKGYANYQLLSYKGYNGDMWRNATNHSDAAIAFCWSFERPGTPRMDVRTRKAKEYYEKFHGKTRPTFSGESVQAAGYVFPQYYQRDYPGSYGTSTIPKAGCGPTSLAMILAGIKGDPSITPYTVVENIKRHWPSGAYYVSGQGSSHCIFGSDFLKKYYGVTSQMYPGQSEALRALESGYPVIGAEDGHILAIIPAPEEYKKQGYKFYILDSARGHGGPYKSAAAASAVVKGNLRFIAIIKP